MRCFAVMGLNGLMAIGTATALKSSDRARHAASIQGEPDALCKNIMFDAVSIQDSSSSLTGSDWQQILTISTQLVDSIEVGENASRFSPISYSYTGKIHWQLDDIRAKDGEKAKQEVRRMPHLYQNTNTPEGLTLAYQAFSHMKQADPARFNNKQVVRIMLLSTDGCANEWDRTKYSTKEQHLEAALKDLHTLPNLLILAVGIGRSICEDEIRNIAGCPASKSSPCPNAKFTDFNNVFDDIPKYIKEVCDVAVELTPPVDEVGTEEPTHVPEEEGGNYAVTIAGGVLGGLALIGAAAGGIAAYTKSK